MPPSPLSPTTFATTQLSLLTTELESEVLTTTTLLTSSTPTALSRAGLALTNLLLVSQRTGLGGKTVLELSPDPATASGSEDLPEHGIRVGDLVVVGEQPSGSARKREIQELEGKGMRGVVTRVGRRAVWVAVEGEEGPTGRVWVVKLADEVTFKRMNQVMTRIQKMGSDEYSTLIRVLFGIDSPTPVQDVGDIEWVDDSLNESQKDAIRFALGSREVALIHGPPGTGKTHTLIELILQMVKRGLRVLVCGPSNISVDNIVERLAPHKLPIVRLGHPARLLPSVLHHSLDILTRDSSAAEIIQDVRKEMDTKQASVRKTKSARERKAIYLDLRELRKEFRNRERKCISTLIKGSKVVLATLHGAGGYQLKDEVFDVVVVDEASQALEAQCWVPLWKAKKVVLAGDHLQLPPTIKSLNSKSKSEIKSETKSEVKSEGGGGEIIKGMTLETTLFDRLIELYGDTVKRMLTTQYRMHSLIMQFPSDTLYSSLLIAANSVKSRLLSTLPYDVLETEDTTEPLIFFDTQGGDFPEKNEEEEEEKGKKGRLLGDSKSNEMEALLVRRHVGNLVEAGVKEEDIAIITPYNAQLALISRTIKETFPGIELGSVDGFQGREKEAIIVSLVRSNPEKEVGFLGEKRRLNGDSETLSGNNKFLKSWMVFLEEKADLRYPDVGELNSIS
ncbi:P-loop containing nucleoside triphosphate hydrolase [Glarea lozoyensis ATCC 20868]|uniref:DNA helicase n=1 Tax=Glarea lozoyensis (strain ATCC 20868 / MF5171) TaxID=1116229 RepID=S3CRI8_GLAL2|nr:P-loop containing nucleoside triphosphate hydrolase [Glarea lozoyensis ATCC 20868]EPE27709.1 P-loop containing nucleoside triphosphate hydrolase [Glarea lozoyensis ATCC 20868]